MTVRTVVFTCAVLAAASAVQAQDDATNNRCWGDITSDFAQIENGIIGQHSRAHDPIFRREAQPRDGVGNVSKDNDGPLSEGGQGDHAVRVGEQLEDATGVPIECD
jgi:hypothetical protein